LAHFFPLPSSTGDPIFSLSFLSARAGSPTHLQPVPLRFQPLLPSPFFLDSNRSHTGSVSSTDATVTCPSLALSPQDHSISATTILLPHVSLVPLFLSSPASQNPEREKPHPSTVGLPWRRRFGRFLAKPSTPAGAPLHPLPHAARNLRGNPQIAPKSSFPSRSLPLFIIDYGHLRPPPPLLSTPSASG
jgi:hypothetical protein